MTARFPGLRSACRMPWSAWAAGQPEVDSAAAPIGGSSRDCY